MEPDSSRGDVGTTINENLPPVLRRCTGVGKLSFRFKFEIFHSGSKVSVANSEVILAP